MTEILLPRTARQGNCLSNFNMQVLKAPESGTGRCRWCCPPGCSPSRHTLGDNAQALCSVICMCRCILCFMLLFCLCCVIVIAYGDNAQASPRWHWRKKATYTFLTLPCIRVNTSCARAHSPTPYTARHWNPHSCFCASAGGIGRGARSTHDRPVPSTHLQPSEG